MSLKSPINNTSDLLGGGGGNIKQQQQQQLPTTTNTILTINMATSTQPMNSGASTSNHNRNNSNNGLLSPNSSPTPTTPTTPTSLQYNHYQRTQPSNQKPLPKPPQYYRKMTDLKLQDDNSVSPTINSNNQYHHHQYQNQYHLQQQHIHHHHQQQQQQHIPPQIIYSPNQSSSSTSTIDDNLATVVGISISVGGNGGILHKARSESDISSNILSASDSSNRKSEDSSSGCKSPSSEDHNHHQQQQNYHTPNKNDSKQQPRRLKSNSTNELGKLLNQNSPNNDKGTFPPLPPVPMIGVGLGVGIGLPPLPPLPPPLQQPTIHCSPTTTAPISTPTTLSTSSSSSSLPTLSSMPISNGSPISTSSSTSAPNLVIPNVSILMGPQAKTHNFKLKYFTQPTRCQLCSQFIWSVIGKQGLICTDCGYPSHKHCGQKVSDYCTSSPPKKKSRDVEKLEKLEKLEKEKEKELIDKLEKEKLEKDKKDQQQQQQQQQEANAVVVEKVVEKEDCQPQQPDLDKIELDPEKQEDIKKEIEKEIENSCGISSQITNENIKENNNESNNNIISKSLDLGKSIDNNINNNPISKSVDSTNNNKIEKNEITLSNSVSSSSLHSLSSSSGSPNGKISPNTDSTNGKKVRRSSLDSSNKEFQNYFKSLVPSGENLITYYSCGYQGSVLKVHGRLYITERYLCFYDHLVFDKNKQRQKVIPISTIKTVEKKSGLAPNGILVKTQDRDYQFCLFLHRDEVFEIIEGLILYQEKQLLCESVSQKNLNGMRQVLNQQKTRISVKASKRTKSDGSSNYCTLRTPISFDDPPLITVIKNNDFEMIQLLLEYYHSNQSDEINQIDTEGYTPLHVAVSTDCSDNMLIYLLKHPTIKVNVRNIDGNAPLHYFCQRFHSPECQKIAQLLFEKGAEVNAQNNNGETPLHKAIFNHSVRLLMVYVLLKNNADVNIVNKAGESALHYAVRLGRLDVLKILITAGADPLLLSTKEKKTPLSLAEENNSHEIIDLLKRLEIIINTLTMSNLTQYKMALILEELSQEGSLSRMDEAMMISIGCYDEEHRKVLYSLKNKKILVTGPPAVTPGAIDLLKELENMDIKNGKWIIPQSELEYTDKIGSGISGKVYKGLYRGREVAIKVLKSAEEAHNREEFLKEFNVLASLQSSLIVGLYGVVLEPRICLVMEYCSRGSLYQVLHVEKMTWERFFSFAFQLLKGISTLHQSVPQIVHRDVKSLNFLVTKDWRIKVADFGLSRFNTKSNQQTLNKTRGTSAFCAPEVFQGKEYSDKSDIYSLGVVFWELAFALLNQRYLHPYGEYKNLNEFQIMLYTSNHNLRPTIPNHCPESVKTLISKCWDKEIEQRPTSTEAITLLTQCEKEYQANSEKWNELIIASDSSKNLNSMDNDSLSYSSENLSFNYNK
eukprot:gene4253-5323_t